MANLSLELLWGNPEWKLFNDVQAHLQINQFEYRSVIRIVRWPRLHNFPIFFVSLEISSSTNLSLKNFYFWTTNKQDKKRDNPPKMHKRAWGTVRWVFKQQFVLSFLKREGRTMTAKSYLQSASCATQTMDTQYFQVSQIFWPIGQVGRIGFEVF